MRLFFCLILLLAFVGCKENKVAQQSVNQLPPMLPDYANTTVPCNVAPLNFTVEGAKDIVAEFTLADGAKKIFNGKENIDIPQDEWQEMLLNAKGKKMTCVVSVWNEQYPEGVSYAPFDINVSADEVDPWIVYRLIPPGYEGWRYMGIYERNIANFDVKPIMINKQNNQGCVNCHSFANYDANHFMFHARGKGGGTVIYNEGKLEKVAIEKIGPQKGASYNIWHPTGKFIAFSSNATRQSFYGHSRDKIEVYDLASDLIIYNVDKKEVYVDERFNDSINWETFPAFSPDGKYLYFSTTKAKRMPMEYEKLCYSIIRVPFNEDGSLGEQIDTLYSASKMGGSALMPRISPDGKYMLFTWAENGTFHIHHKEADLKMIDLETGALMELPEVNSNDVESYHSWSSNGKWIMFSSKRVDTRYTRLFFAHWDGKKFSKPFMLPQKRYEDNVQLMHSYNIPEFIKSPVEIDKETLADLFK